MMTTTKLPDMAGVPASIAFKYLAASWRMSGQISVASGMVVSHYTVGPDPNDPVMPHVVTVVLPMLGFWVALIERAVALGAVDSDEARAAVTAKALIQARRALELGGYECP